MVISANQIKFKSQIRQNYKVSVHQGIRKIYCEFYAQSDKLFRRLCTEKKTYLQRTFSNMQLQKLQLNEFLLYRQRQRLKVLLAHLGPMMENAENCQQQNDNIQKDIYKRILFFKRHYALFSAMISMISFFLKCISFKFAAHE